MVVLLGDVGEVALLGIFVIRGILGGDELINVAELFIGAFSP